MIYRRDGMGGYRYYPEQSELMIYCTFVDMGHRYIIIQYLDLPFCFRVVKREGIELLDEQTHHCLLPFIDLIDQGQFDNQETAKLIYDF
ncbi:hypothetical protein [Halobacillus mangrovi]|uniref:Uncharacterized protein n=1 Tax=Halobacillus mangrovi TaxID=402384 RepID=A0A1W5ZV26_9BACI|nr:hypothetical protein [Halobacillus mangrovi]ARI77111.1 hypothetical protein HM131_09790 [Halobacillus mangrovi]